MIMESKIENIIVYGCSVIKIEPQYLHNDQYRIDIILEDYFTDKSIHDRNILTIYGEKGIPIVIKAMDGRVQGLMNDIACTENLPEGDISQGQFDIRNK